MTPARWGNPPSLGVNRLPVGFIDVGVARRPPPVDVWSMGAPDICGSCGGATVIGRDGGVGRGPMPPSILAAVGSRDRIFINYIKIVYLILDDIINVTNKTLFNNTYYHNYDYYIQ